MQFQQFCAEKFRIVLVEVISSWSNTANLCKPTHCESDYSSWPLLISNQKHTAMITPSIMTFTPCRETCSIIICWVTVQNPSLVLAVWVMTFVISLGLLMQSKMQLSGFWKVQHNCALSSLTIQLIADRFQMPCRVIITGAMTYMLPYWS